MIPVLFCGATFKETRYAAIHRRRASICLSKFLPRDSRLRETAKFLMAQVILYYKSRWVKSLPLFVVLSLRKLVTRQLVADERQFASANSCRQYCRLKTCLQGVLTCDIHKTIAIFRLREIAELLFNANALIVE